MRMNVTRPMPRVTCPKCDGMGDIEGNLQGRELMRCPQCNGTGRVYQDEAEDLLPSDGFKQPIDLRYGRREDD